MVSIEFKELFLRRFSISITSPMGELKIEETPLSALFDQARKIHLSASESGIDQRMPVWQKIDDGSKKPYIF
ncbi:unnamed protein product [Camellia sinensis]